MTRIRTAVSALVVALVMIPANGSAQTGSVTGTVTNKATGQPIVGAQVNLEHSRYGTVTGENGRFLILNVPPGTYTVVIQFIGFGQLTQTNVRVAQGATAQVDAQLEETVLSLQELVVTGVSDPTAGVKLPFTVAKVSADKLLVPTTNSALASIQGKVAGASIIRASGQPGSGVNILLRSPTAFEESNSPLIVVDGVVIARSFGGTTADLEALDIVSIEVIKGAAAASLYGSRASAGVVSITTNRGRNTALDQTRVTSRTEIGVDHIGKEIPLSTHHHYRVNAEGTALVDAVGNTVTWGSRVSKPIRIADAEYPGALFNNQRALFQPDRYLSQNVSLSHNTASSNFLVSLNRFDQRGALENNDGYWRNTGRVSIDHRIGDRFSVALVGSYARTWQDEISSGGTVSTNPYTAAVAYPPYVDLTTKDAAGNYLQAPDSSVELENPLWRQATRDNFEERGRVLSSLNVRFSPVRWLSFDAQYSYDRSDIKTQVYVPKGVPTSISEDVPTTGQLELTHQGTNAHNGSIAMVVNRVFGDLNARLTTRGLFEKENTEFFESDGRDFLVKDVRDLSVAGTLNNVASSTQDIRSNGYLADVGLDFRDRYIADVLVRRDGSSLFGPQNRWHTYYRASAAWRMGEEPWFNIPNIDEFKLRYAVGTAGGRPGFSSQYELWSVSRTAGLSRNTAGNSSLKPHYTREQEFGLDIIGYNNRVSLELVYARQLSRDQIIIVPVPTITGFNSGTANAGTIEGYTYEATLQARLLNRRNLTWQITAVADHSRNEITEWGRACFYGSNAGRDHEFTCTGNQAGDFWLQTFVKRPDDLPNGVLSRASEFQVNDEGYLVWVGAGNQYTEGISKNLWGTSFSADGITYRWGEPILKLDDQNLPVVEWRGSSLPDVNFGITNNIQFGAFSIYALLRGQIGGEIYSDSRQFLYGQFRHADVDQTGKPDELKKTVDYYSRGLYNGNGWTDVFLEDATYLKLGELSVRYRFNRSQLQKVLGAAAPSDISIGLNGRNLVTLTGYRGFDPERGSPLSRVESMGYPHLRTITAVVDITF